MSAEDAGDQVAAQECTIKAQLQQFLDEWFYRILSSSLGKAWSRQKAITLLVDIFSMVGIEFKPGEKESLPLSTEDEPLMDAILADMPQGLRDSWETVALQIQTVLHEAARIRSAAEDEATEGEAVAELFGESGSDQAGLSQQVLKASVIYAAQEVATHRRIHITWRKNTDARIDRLLNAATEAEHSQQQLLALEAQLAEYKGDAKAKGKGVLMSMAEGQNSALVHSVFSGWIGYVEKVHAEAAIRKKFTDQIELCEKKLFQYKEAQIANIRGVIMRGAMEDQDVLMHMVWKFWVDEVAEHKADGDTAAELKALQDKMAAFEQQQKENAGKFMTRMASGNEASLKNLCLEAWIAFHKDYLSHKEEEEAVKNREAAFKKHMDEKKDQAKEVLDRMLASSDHGLLSMIMQNWASWLKEEKKAKELEFHLQQAEGKFKSLNSRQAGNANKVQGRVNEQMNLNILQRIFIYWLIETKGNRVESHYNAKYDSKRRQLQGVQNLFKSFAMQLEQNLGQDDDSSSRSQRRANRKHSSTNNGAEKMPKGSDASVSLPSIKGQTAA